MYSPEAGGSGYVPAAVQISTRSGLLRYGRFRGDRGPIAQQPHDEPRHRDAQQIVRVAEVHAAELLHLAQAVLHGVEVHLHLAGARPRVAARREVALERLKQRAAGPRVALEHRAEDLARERLELVRASAVDEEAEDAELVGGERLPRAADQAQDVDAPGRARIGLGELGRGARDRADAGRYAQARRERGDPAAGPRGGPGEALECALVALGGHRGGDDVAGPARERAGQPLGE